VHAARLEHLAAQVLAYSHPRAALDQLAEDEPAAVHVIARALSGDPARLERGCTDLGDAGLPVVDWILERRRAEAARVREHMADAHPGLSALRELGDVIRHRGIEIDAPALPELRDRDCRDRLAR
jgi:hypothetical protein